MKYIVKEGDRVIIDQAVITAAGKGSRMKSNSSKPMTKVGEKRLIQYGIDSLLSCGINKIYIIYSQYSEDILQLKNIYPDIYFIKQEILNGSLSTFNLIDNICKTPFLQLDCDIIFSQVDFRKMLESINYNEFVDGYFAVVTKPTSDSPKYIKLENGRIINFDKKSFTNGYAGGMIYLWFNFPIKLAQNFYENNNSLAQFYSKLVKEKNIKAMYIKRLFDIDTMTDVIEAEKKLKTILE